eukprot:g38931.t1
MEGGEVVLPENGISVPLPSDLESTRPSNVAEVPKDANQIVQASSKFELVSQSSSGLERIDMSPNLKRRDTENGSHSSQDSSEPMSVENWSHTNKSDVETRKGSQTIQTLPETLAAPQVLPHTEGLQPMQVVESNGKPVSAHGTNLVAVAAPPPATIEQMRALEEAEEDDEDEWESDDEEDYEPETSQTAQAVAPAAPAAAAVPPVVAPHVAPPATHLAAPAPPSAAVTVNRPGLAAVPPGRDVHDQQGSATCPLNTCRKTFLRPNNMRRHSRTHDPSRNLCLAKHMQAAPLLKVPLPATQSAFPLLPTNSPLDPYKTPPPPGTPMEVSPLSLPSAAPSASKLQSRAPTAALTPLSSLTPLTLLQQPATMLLGEVEEEVEIEGEEEDGVVLSASEPVKADRIFPPQVKGDYSAIGIKAFSDEEYEAYFEQPGWTCEETRALLDFAVEYGYARFQYVKVEPLICGRSKEECEIRFCQLAAMAALLDRGLVTMYKPLKRNGKTGMGRRASKTRVKAPVVAPTRVSRRLASRKTQAKYTYSSDEEDIIDSASESSQDEVHWEIDIILAMREVEKEDSSEDEAHAKIGTEEPKSNSGSQKEYYCKAKGWSYMHCRWYTLKQLMQDTGEKSAKDKVKRFEKKWPELEAKQEELYGGEYFDPSYLNVDRIIAEKTVDIAEDAWRNALEGQEDVASKDVGIVQNGMRKVPMYLVKWQRLSYSECTWEMATDIKNEMKLAEFHRFNRFIPTRTGPTYTLQELQLRLTRWYPESPVYKSGHRLRDYQVEGLNWLIKNYLEQRNCILGDEMGLGKTVQVVSFLNHLVKVENVRGPFLVVVPLSTIYHWKREVETWTSLNCVVYHDPFKGKETRKMIREYEFYYPNSKQVKVNVLVTTYEVATADITELAALKFCYLVVDEGHRLKNKSNKLLEALNCLDFVDEGHRLKNKSNKLLEALNCLDCPRRLLLTGTPIQNSMNELFTLFNYLCPKEFKSAEDFNSRFGELEKSDQVKQLREKIRPFILRRMKETVESSIPPKEETIIDIELTTLQKVYYRAIYERNLSFLEKGVSKAQMPRLVNIEMQLRKCCNHPFLISSVVEKELPERHTEEEYCKKMVDASGKMVLLSKLLPKLKVDNHRVLIFSQMVKVLDLLEEYLKFLGYGFVRLDGRVTGSAREARIACFNEKDSD